MREYRTISVNITVAFLFALNRAEYPPSPNRIHQDQPRSSDANLRGARRDKSFVVQSFFFMPIDRYAPEVPFPAYAFVPGRHPHPVTNPSGHSYGHSHAVPYPLDPARPGDSIEFLSAVDLFNAGFYWEAHEEWEGLWIAAGRRGELADFLKSLIKLAAAGVKAREGQITGVERHARRASDLLRSMIADRSQPGSNYCGLNLDELALAAQSLAEQPIVDDTPSTMGRVVIPVRLILSDLDRA